MKEPKRPSLTSPAEVRDWSTPISPLDAAAHTTPVAPGLGARPRAENGPFARLLAKIFPPTLPALDADETVWNTAIDSARTQLAAISATRPTYLETESHKKELERASALVEQLRDGLAAKKAAPPEMRRLAANYPALVEEQNALNLRHGKLLDENPASAETHRIIDIERGELARRMGPVIAAVRALENAIPLFLRRDAERAGAEFRVVEAELHEAQRRERNDRSSMEARKTADPQGRQRIGAQADLLRLEARLSEHADNIRGGKARLEKTRARLAKADAAVARARAALLKGRA